MSLTKKDFYGKEVASAIKKACDSFEVAQENLEIEVIETGSTGIFGLIRKKAHIRAAVKPEEEDDSTDYSMDSLFSAKEKAGRARKKATPKVEVEPQKHEDTEKASQLEVIVDVVAESVKVEKPKIEEPEVEEPEVASSKSIEIVKTELLQMVKLMGFPSTLEVDCDGLSISCTLRGDYEENLTGVDGKVLDSLQYLLRKVVTRKVPERLRISINVGDFREKRLENLKIKAVELATLVKQEGKTQVLPALNPSERRSIHMILQEDKDIRSRSVGDGLFKKILIYKPGKGNRGGRKRPQSKGRNKTSQSVKPEKDA